ncbi:probable chitinase 2 [Bacillus rossius redtenbacheri]|uniref:probable chitinase 2 n=1 Tax=Bacillus rossius redtenbacheri TaxID=93214 RepID=UPI002FDCC829
MGELCRVAVLICGACAAVTVFGAGNVSGNPSMSVAAARPPHDRAVVCYVAAWAGYRPGRGAFALDDLDPALCTHLVYAFAGLNITSNSIRSLDPYHDLEENYGKGSYKKMTNLRSRFPHLKVTIAIGGWNEGSANYSILAAEPGRRQVFIASTVKFIQEHGFDGLDLDWEFPGKRGGSPSDKQNFVQLVKELRQEFDRHGWLLTAALGAAEDTIDGGYDVPQLSQHLDFLHAMCYDYHGTWDKRTGANAPLRPLFPGDKLNVEYSIKYFLKLGVPPRKLIMGMPLYGRTFLVEGQSQGSGLGETALETSFQGPYTRENGFMGYNEICEELGNNHTEWQIHWDDKSETPYAVSGNKVIAYDDERSLTEKVKFAMRNDIGGVMAWSIDTDDFHGDCKRYQADDNAIKISYPLMRSVNKAITETLAEMENEVVTRKEKEREKEREKAHNAEQPGSGVVATTTAVPCLLAACLCLSRMH